MTKKSFISILIVCWVVAVGAWLFGTLAFLLACFSCPSTYMFLLPEIIGTIIILLIAGFFSKFQYEKYKGDASAALKAKKILYTLIYSTLTILIILLLVMKIIE